MTTLNYNKKLWRIPQQGIIYGVCAGLAYYLNIPVKLVRVVSILSIFFGLTFVTLLTYIILSFVLDQIPDSVINSEDMLSNRSLLDEIDIQLAMEEKRLRNIEHYITSNTFTLRNRFRQL